MDQALEVICGKTYDLEKILKLLRSQAKLERDNGVAKLDNSIDIIAGNDIRYLEDTFLSILQDASQPWEAVHGSLCACKVLLLKADVDFGFHDKLIKLAVDLHEYEEGRIRLAAGELLGAICAHAVQTRGNARDVWYQVKDKILAGISTNLERKQEVLSNENAEKLAAKLVHLQQSGEPPKAGDGTTVVEFFEAPKLTHETNLKEADSSESLEKAHPAQSTVSTVSEISSGTADLSSAMTSISDAASTPSMSMSLASTHDDGTLTPRTAQQIFHDTAGWKHLETYMKSLQCILEGCGSAFNAFITPSLLELVFATLRHTNRFVRETGFYVCSSLVKCGSTTEGDKVVALQDSNAIFKHSQDFSEKLAAGLSDNWSQVRLAASVATRSFLQSMPDDKARRACYPHILPPMCLNRYYVAEGVRLYSQETWKLFTGTEGRHLVQDFMKHVVSFYIEQCEADNHAVREAGCACIAELGQKVDAEYTRPYVQQLLSALLVCFADDSWPVRDAACIASGHFVLSFPEEAKPSMEMLLPLFYLNLEDNIPSVREGAAAALANVARAYGEWASQRVLTVMRDGLKGVASQPADAERFSKLEPGPATYGVARRAAGEERQDQTSNQIMYSCGSLAPKLGRGKRAGGCMDHQFKRPSQPWELADGCVHLAAELAGVPGLVSKVGGELHVLAETAEVRHYTQHLQLLETLCRRLPDMAEGMGKRPFKAYLELFIDSIFYSLTSDSPLASAAAADCLVQFSQFLGPNIMRARVERHNPNYLMEYDRCVRGTGGPMGPGMMPGGPGMFPGGPGMFPGGPRIPGHEALPPFLARGAPMAVPPAPFRPKPHADKPL